MKVILCPICRKEIGKRIPDGAHDSGGLGAVVLYKSKYDYRRASHLWWQGDRHSSGLLCRSCAREKFPSGKYWVLVHGASDLCAGGDSGDPWKYTAEEKALEKANALEAKFGPMYHVEERRI